MVGVTSFFVCLFLEKDVYLSAPLLKLEREIHCYKKLRDIKVGLCLKNE